MTSVSLLLFWAEAALPASSFGLLRVPPTTRSRGITRNNGNRLHPCLSSSQRSQDASDIPPRIDRQTDDKYGRGISHISADLNEGDIVAYQDGTWYLDGTEVGDGTDPTVRYMQVDTIQLVWTHDCEHGMINGFDAMVSSNDGAELVSIGGTGAVVERGRCFVIGDEYIQIGPDQVLARIPTASLEKNWKDTARGMLLSQVDFHPDEEVKTS